MQAVTIFNQSSITCMCLSIDNLVVPHCFKFILTIFTTNKKFHYYFTYVHRQYMAWNVCLGLKIFKFVCSRWGAILWHITSINWWGKKCSLGSTTYLLKRSPCLWSSIVRMSMFLMHIVYIWAKAERRHFKMEAIAKTVLKQIIKEFIIAVHVIPKVIIKRKSSSYILAMLMVTVSLPCVFMCFKSSESIVKVSEKFVKFKTVFKVSGVASTCTLLSIVHKVVVSDLVVLSPFLWIWQYLISCR